MKEFMRPCAIFLSVVMFLNMMDLGVCSSRALGRSGAN